MIKVLIPLIKQENRIFRIPVHILMLILAFSLPVSALALGASETSSTSMTAVQDNTIAIIPNKITQKVLVINIDPLLENRNNIKMHQLGGWWNDPKILSDQYISDFKQFTNGCVNYEIADWIELDEYPRSTTGFMYDDETYLNTYDAAMIETGGAYWSSDKWHKPVGFDFDYNYYIDEFDIVQRIQNSEIDEVWIFTGPCTGVAAYESQMVGKDAYWCNSPPIQRNDCKPFVIYAFNYERDVGCMLEDAGHRMESVMANVFGRWDYQVPIENMNKWERFTLFDKVSPGNAACGNVHFAPNSVSDYDWGNTNQVMTSYVDWLEYPELTGRKVLADASAWGNGNMRLHHDWWFGCIPKTGGVDEEGYYNNWWDYFCFFRGRVTSPIYKFDDDMVNGITPGTTLEVFTDGFQLPMGFTISVKKTDGNDLPSGNKVGTGMKMQILSGSNIVLDSTIIIFGDTSGDGNINALDLLAVKRHILGLQTLSGASATAANTDHGATGSINALDLLKIKRHILGMEVILQ